MNDLQGSVEDYNARLNLTHQREVWVENQAKISYVFNKTKRFIHSNTSVCEIGIGNGYLLRLISQLGVFPMGIDISRYSITTLKKLFKHNNIPVELLRADISQSLDIENLDEKFDLIYCLDILEHIEGDGIHKAISNLKKMLKKESYLVITLPWKENLKNQMVRCPNCQTEFHRIGHYHSFQNLDQVLNLFQNQFKIVHYNFIPPTDLPNKLFLILKKTLLRRKYFNGKFPNFYSTILIIARKE